MHESYGLETFEDLVRTKSIYSFVQKCFRYWRQESFKINWNILVMLVIFSHINGLVNSEQILDTRKFRIWHSLSTLLSWFYTQNTDFDTEFNSKRINISRYVIMLRLFSNSWLLDRSWGIPNAGAASKSHQLCASGLGSNMWLHAGKLSQFVNDHSLSSYFFLLLVPKCST